MIKREKELYQKEFEDVVQNFSADIFIWGEDLPERKLIIYPGKLKDISRYKVIKKQLEPCGIVLVDTGKKNFLRCISATVNMETADIYLAEAVFNTIWRSLRCSVDRSIRFAAENGIEMPEHPEDILAFDELMRPGSIPVLKNHVIIYQAKQLTEEERYKNSRKQSLLDNVNMQYFYAEDGDFFHDKECEEIKKILPEKFCASKTVPDKEICPKCRRKIYFRKACYPNTKQMAVCGKIFQKQKVGNTILHHFVMETGFRFHVTDLNELQVEGKEDRWIIKGLNSDNLELWHNNYVRTSTTGRYITNGYHNQKVDGLTFVQMLKYIERYSFDKHLQHEKAEKAAAELVPEISFAENVPVTNGFMKKKCILWCMRVWKVIKKLFIYRDK